MTEQGGGEQGELQAFFSEGLNSDIVASFAAEMPVWRKTAEMVRKRIFRSRISD